MRFLIWITIWGIVCCWDVNPSRLNSDKHAGLARVFYWQTKHYLGPAPTSAGTKLLSKDDGCEQADVGISGVEHGDSGGQCHVPEVVDREEQA